MVRSNGDVLTIRTTCQSKAKRSVPTRSEEKLALSNTFFPQSRQKFATSKTPKQINKKKSVTNCANAKC
jgi:hypothetical protein